MPPLRPKSQRSTKVATINEDAPLQMDDSTKSNSRRKGASTSPKAVSFKENGTTTTTASAAAASSSASTPSPTADSKPKSSKQVHWNHRVEKKRHHRVRDLTDDEKESVWYTEGDTKIILAMAKVTVKMMMKGEPCDDVDYCSRGLEGKTPVGSKRRQKNKLRVRKAVLEEQEIQREEGVFDPDYLAQVSMFHSKDIIEEAHAVALADEQLIQEYVDLTHGDYSPVQPRRMNRS